MSVHTIFVREHNRIATWFGQNTFFNAERIYQETRKIIGACLQVITYNEFLPLILSRKTVGEIFCVSVYTYAVTRPVLIGAPKMAKKVLKKCLNSQKGARNLEIVLEKK